MGKTITLDVREQLRNKLEPFAQIMAAVKSLQPGDRLVILAIFEPKPLYTVMRLRGYDHHTERIDEGDWKVTFYQKGENP